jgi:ribonuclease H / adenosylcobalamin/alpha-ribazole phosphatase
LRELLLVRHAHARSNAEDCVSSDPPGDGLSAQGVEETRALHDAIAGDPIGLGVATRLVRTQETLELALAGREIPTIILPGLDEIAFGSFEGGPLGEYRTWAWANEPDAACPGGGESRAQAAERFAGALDVLLARPEDVVLAVSHALPVRYVLDASDGGFPVARIGRVPHATPFLLDAEAVERAAETLRVWATAPRFADA